MLSRPETSDLFMTNTTLQDFQPRNTSDGRRQVSHWLIESPLMLFYMLCAMLLSAQVMTSCDVTHQNLNFL